MRPDASAELERIVLDTLHDVQLDCGALFAAFDAAAMAGGDPLQLLVCAAVLALCTSITDMRYTRFGSVVDTLQRGLALRERPHDPGLALLVGAGELVGRALRHPDDAALPALAESIVASAADATIDASVRGAAATASLALFDRLLDVGRIRWAELALRDVRADAALNPRLAAEWDFLLVRAYHVTRQFEHAGAIRQRWSGSAAEPVIELKLALLDARTSLADGRFAEARLALQHAEPLLGPRTAVAAGVWHFLQSRLALAATRFDDALVQARLALRLLREVEYPPRWMGPVTMQEGQVQIALGRPALAVPFFEAAAHADEGVQSDYCLCLADAARALDHADRGDVEAMQGPLAAGLGLARRLDWVDFLRPNPRAAARLCSLAFEHGIEPEFARRVVAERRFEAPRAEQAEWPWPVKVRTLGGFEIEIGGRPLALRGKGARKPLELLHFIVASGGSDVPTGSASFALWPELEGDHAKAALNVALHRLRKLLGHDAAIELEVGKLAVAPGLVWVDCLAFERMVDPLGAPLTAAQAPLAERALALYRGPWRKDDDDVPWQAVYRNRLASKFVRLTRALLAWHLQRRAPAAARDLLERTLEIDPLAEDLARELMQLLAAQGETTAALAAFERCRLALRALRGTAPSAATMQLQARLRDPPPA